MEIDPIITEISNRIATVGIIGLGYPPTCPLRLLAEGGLAPARSRFGLAGAIFRVSQRPVSFAGLAGTAASAT